MIIVEVVGVYRQHGGDARDGIGEIVVRVRRVIDAVLAAACGLAFKANDLRDQARVVEQIDLLLN